MRTDRAWLRLRVACVSLVAVLTAASCSDEESQLAGHTYLLESSEGFEPVDDTTVRLSFDEEGQLGLHAGCNHLSGSFAIDDSHLVTDGLASTEIGCDPELHAQDEWLSAFVASGPRVELKGDRLTLDNEKATLRFLDREVASPDRPLVGTEWTVDTFITGDAAGSIPLDKPPTLRFDAQGKVQIFTGCNEGNGSYEQNGETLTLSSVQYTDKACPSAASPDQHVQSVLSDGQVSFEVEERRLTLTRGDKGVGAIAPK